MQTKEIFLANPRVFCAGVNRAIEIVEIALRIYKPPIYVKHEIVHNQYVVNSLREKGVVFIEDFNRIREGSVVIFSAHGVPPNIWDQAKEKNLEVIDATCPLVTKVHLEARRYAKEGYHILLIGHMDHVETVGTLGEAPDQTTVIESVEDVEKLNIPQGQKLAYLTQTTLSLLDTKQIIAALGKKFQNIESPHKSDICYATTNRQYAVQKIAEKAQILLVIGSQNSSNSNRLKELGEKMGVASYLIENSDHIDHEWIGDDITKVGLTSGASVPDILVEGTIKRLKEEFGFEKVMDIKFTDEDVTFKLPKKLKEKVTIF